MEENKIKPSQNKRIGDLVVGTLFLLINLKLKIIVIIDIIWKIKLIYWLNEELYLSIVIMIVLKTFFLVKVFMATISTFWGTYISMKNKFIKKVINIFIIIYASNVY